MPRLIIMDEELHEALIVIEIPAWFMREVESGERSHFPHFRMHVPEDGRIDVGPARYEPPRICTVKLIRVTLNGKKHLFWYGYAMEPEMALELRCAFLPGQLGEVQRREKAAYFTGLLEAAFR